MPVHGEAPASRPESRDPALIPEIHAGGLHCFETSALASSSLGTFFYSTLSFNLYLYFSRCSFIRELENLEGSPGDKYSTLTKFRTLGCPGKHFQPIRLLLLVFTLRNLFI